MLREINEIRNGIEHEDNPPPSHEDCDRMLDVCWYFLRSTDPLVRRVVCNLRLQERASDESPYDIHMELGPDRKWVPGIRGWLSPTLVSRYDPGGWLELRARRILRLRDYRAKFPQHVVDGRLNEKDVMVEGLVRGPEKHLYALYCSYFRCG